MLLIWLELFTCSTWSLMSGLPGCRYDQQRRLYCKALQAYKQKAQYVHELEEDDPEFEMLKKEEKV